MEGTADTQSREDQTTLEPSLLVAAYCQGAFPMAPDRCSDRIEWFSPDPRAILPLDQRFRCSRNLRRLCRQGRFDIRFDTAFDQVIEACARPRVTQRETWINDTIIAGYIRMHELGLAHSVEAWREGILVGGLYGVSINGAFFGESMFHRADLGGTDASKVCLVELVEHLRKQEFLLLDAQMPSPHLEQFGLVNLPRGEYLQLLNQAVSEPVHW